MKFRIYVAFGLAFGLLAGQGQAEQLGIPDGNWLGDIDSKCTIKENEYFVFREPYLSVRCSSGSCYAQLSVQVHDKETNQSITSLIPDLNLGETAPRLTIVGWGPIRNRNIENGNVVNTDNHEQQDVDAYLQGLTLQFLPNDDLGISIQTDSMDCTGIILSNG